MNDKELDQQLKDLFKSLKNDDEQLTFDFGDNMNGYQAQPALTISSGSVDTISLDNTLTGAIGSSGSGYNFQYDYTNAINGGYTITTGSGGGGGGYNITTGTGLGNLSPNITLGSGGGIGTILTTGTNGLTFSDWGNAYPSTSNTLQVKGDAEFDGDVKIKGKSIAKTLENIEEKLAILHPNEELEKKWDELRYLRNRYVQLEKEIKEKEKMWDILKK